MAAATLQWQEVERAAGGLASPSSRSAFHEPLLRFLEQKRRRDPGGPWRVFETATRPSLVRLQGDARIEAVALGPSHLTLRVHRAGAATVKVRWSPDWHVSDGCVEQAGGWTRVLLHRDGIRR